MWAAFLYALSAQQTGLDTTTVCVSTQYDSVYFQVQDGGLQRREQRVIVCVAYVSNSLQRENLTWQDAQTILVVA